MMKMVQGNFSDPIMVELGTELSFPGHRFDHQFAELRDPTRGLSSAVMRSKDHRHLSITQVKIHNGIIHPYVMSIDTMGFLLSGLKHLGESIQSKELAKALGINNAD